MNEPLAGCFPHSRYLNIISVPGRSSTYSAPVVVQLKVMRLPLSGKSSISSVNEVIASAVRAGVGVRDDSDVGVEAGGWGFGVDVRASDVGAISPAAVKVMVGVEMAGDPVLFVSFISVSPLSGSGKASLPFGVVSAVGGNVGRVDCLQPTNNRSNNNTEHNFRFAFNFYGSFLKIGQR